MPTHLATNHLAESAARLGGVLSGDDLASVGTIQKSPASLRSS